MYWCVDDIKGFTVGKQYRVHRSEGKIPQPSDLHDFWYNSGSASYDKYKTQIAWHGSEEDMQDYNYRVSGLNALRKKKKKSQDTKKRRKKPLIDLIDDNGHIKSLREGQIKRCFTFSKSHMEVKMRDYKIKKLLK
jgi:hypothetical protein